MKTFKNILALFLLLPSLLMAQENLSTANATNSSTNNDDQFTIIKDKICIQKNAKTYNLFLSNLEMAHILSIYSAPSETQNQWIEVQKPTSALINCFCTEDFCAQIRGRYEYNLYTADNSIQYIKGRMRVFDKEYWFDEQQSLANPMCASNITNNSQTQKMDMSGWLNSSSLPAPVLNLEASKSAPNNLCKVQIVNWALNGAQCSASAGECKLGYSCGTQANATVFVEASDKEKGSAEFYCDGTNGVLVLVPGSADCK